jgi:hypothetical protein
MTSESKIEYPYRSQFVRSLLGLDRKRYGHWTDDKDVVRARRTSAQLFTPGAMGGEGRQHKSKPGLSSLPPHCGASVEAGTTALCGTSVAAVEVGTDCPFRFQPVHWRRPNRVILYRMLEAQ